MAKTSCTDYLERAREMAALAGKKSGGEMKRAEILQLAMLQPKIAILDETDSGLDADAVRLASQSIAEIGREKMGLLIITHHDKLLEHNPPDFTHVMLGGRIVESSRGSALANELHTSGYDRIRQAYGPARYDRLKALKKRYDPDNFFRLNQNIPAG